MKITTVVVGDLETNCYILGGGGEAVVIDPGGDAAKIIKVLDGENTACRLIVLTHAHADHIVAVAALKEKYGARICAHPLEFAALASPLENLSAYTSGEPVTAPPADTALAGGDVVEAGGARLEVMHTPGHTPGSICLILRNDAGEPDAIFTGDTIFSETVGRCDLPGGSEEALDQSLKKFRTMEGDPAIYPGHGRPTTLAREKLVNPYLGARKP